MHKFVFKLGSTLSVFVEGDKSSKEEIIISEQARVGFKESLALFHGDPMKTCENKGNAGFVIVFLEGDELHVDIQLVQLEEYREFRCLSIKCGWFADFRLFE